MIVGKLMLVALAFWLTLRAFAQSWSWGLFILLMPLAFGFLEKWTGTAVAFGLLGFVQLCYVLRHRRAVGKTYVATLVLFFVGAMLIHNGMRGMLP